VIIDLPYPPSVNHYYGRNRRGSVFIKPRGRIFRSDVIQIVSEMKVKAMQGRIKCHLLVQCPDKRERDLDNVGKAVLDAMQHAGVYLRDSQIDLLTFQRGGVIRGGKIIVNVSEIDAAANNQQLRDP
jgi:crossover junction endodeoxyribonuclease RusA